MSRVFRWTVRWQLLSECKWELPYEAGPVFFSVVPNEGRAYAAACGRLEKKHCTQRSFGRAENIFCHWLKFFFKLYKNLKDARHFCQIRAVRAIYRNVNATLSVV